MLACRMEDGDGRNPVNLFRICDHMYLVHINFVYFDAKVFKGAWNNIPLADVIHNHCTKHFISLGVYF